MVVMCPDEDNLSANDEPTFMYYVNDGVYGSFNCLLFDHAVLETPFVEVKMLHFLMRICLNLIWHILSVPIFVIIGFIMMSWSAKHFLGGRAHHSINMFIFQFFSVPLVTSPFVVWWC